MKKVVLMEKVNYFFKNKRDGHIVIHVTFVCLAYFNSIYIYIYTYVHTYIHIAHFYTYLHLCHCFWHLSWLL